jgi:hypothetical protein
MSKKAEAAEASPGKSRGDLLAELKKAREELIALQAGAPVLPQLRVDDDTPEMLALELVKQGGRLLAASPEARTLENVTRYSDEANQDVFLKGHAGDDLRSGRISRGRDNVDRAALTCAFSPQPSVLERMAESGELRSRGFFARWLYGLPPSQVGYRQVSPPPPAVPHVVRERYRELLTNLWRTDAPPPDVAKSHELTFDATAAAELNAFLVWVEAQLRPEGELRELAAWGNKLGGLCLRLCGVLHAADGAAVPCEVWRSTPISAGVVRRAVRICREYAVPHALATFDLMGVSERVVGARRLLKWIAGRENPAADFSKKQAFDSCRRSFNDTASDMDPALELLEEHFVIRPKGREQRSGPGRKPSPVYEVNPLVAQMRPQPPNTPNPPNGGTVPPGSHSADLADCAADVSDSPDCDEFLP